ncbi:MAG TPA: FKBP-type peptidyl-prolyl cis-trans isomerase [Hanamia sp.]|jgi:FKBP-type peptidyl-prolyl cis-trans isomerase|nr:FKBP-type peptidyl-prolyl cis-trans isomerase [Hanamia sp.]
MKTIFLLFLLSFSVCYGQIKKPVAKKAIPAKAATAMTSTDSLSYSIGVQVAEYYKTMGVEKINTDYVAKAFHDVLNNKPLTISEDECNMNIQQKLQQFMSKKISAVKEEGIRFLEENKKRPGVITLPSGLQYEIITKGTGPIPTAKDTVRANYIGTLINGEEFDNSYKRGTPLTIPVSGVIRGWTEALELMPVGSKWKLFIPSDLGYGDRGAGSAIPGGAALIFEIELLNIVNK